LLVFSIALTFNSDQYFDNKSNVEHDYDATIVTGRTLREHLVAARVELKQKRGELLKIKNEKSKLKESYIQQQFNLLKKEVEEHKFKILSLNVMENKVENKKIFIQKLDKIHKSLNYYTINNQITQQEFEYLIKDIIGQINNL